MNGTHDDEDNGEEESSINKVFVIQNIILMMPKQFQRKGDGDGVISSQPKDEETVSSDNEDERFSKEETEKIEAGTFLWDLSVIPHHAEFLEKQGLVFILHNLLFHFRNHSSRTVEISLGIIGNMCNVDSLCHIVSNHLFNGENFVITIASLILNCNDSPSLSEAFRIFSVGIFKSRNVGDAWRIRFLETDFLKRIGFILNMNFNRILLERTIVSFSYLFYGIEEGVLDRREEIGEILEAILEVLFQFYENLGAIE